MAGKQMGRPSLFSPKDGNRGYQILKLTKEGQRLFEAARKKLAKLAKTIAGWEGEISDANTLEFLVRGDAETSRYLRQKQKAAE
jgi:hypothetical protein